MAHGQIPPAFINYPMKTNPTRGTWITETGSDRIRIIDSLTESHEIAVVELPASRSMIQAEIDSREQYQANARLIAASPSLLEAAKAIRDYMQETGQDIYNPTGGQLGRAYAMLADAIALADGSR